MRKGPLFAAPSQRWPSGRRRERLLLPCDGRGDKSMISWYVCCGAPAGVGAMGSTQNEAWSQDWIRAGRDGGDRGRGPSLPIRYVTHPPLLSRKEARAQSTTHSRSNGLLIPSPPWLSTWV